MIALIWFIGLIVAYWLMYVKYPSMTITHDNEEKIVDKLDVKEFIEKNFEGVCNYDFKTNTVYILDNSIMTTPKFIEMLNKWKVYLQPSLF